MPAYDDDLKELAALLHRASKEQADEQCPYWSALSLKAATALEAVAGANEPGRRLRDSSLWGRFRRWLWWVLNPAGPQ